MKKNIFLVISIAFLALISSCEKDEGKLPNISFKTGTNYTSTTTVKSANSPIVIGINASKAEDKDVLKQFNISKSVNGASNITVFSKVLSGSEGDNYSYDYADTLSSTIGDVEKYTFTVTNRDGLLNQVSLTLTVQ
jgi:transposase